MIDVLFKTFVTFFVIYGMAEMLSKCLSHFKSGENKEIFIFIHVKNKEESLEYIVRTTIINYLAKYGGRIIPYVVVVDKGSQDSTKEISQKLANDYDFLYYATEEEYNQFINDIEHGG